MEKWLQLGNPVAPQAVAAELGNGIAAVDSCVTAVYLALACRENDFVELIEYVKKNRWGRRHNRSNGGCGLGGCPWEGCLA